MTEHDRNRQGMKRQNRTWWDEMRIKKRKIRQIQIIQIKCGEFHSPAADSSHRVCQRLSCRHKTAHQSATASLCVLPPDSCHRLQESSQGDHSPDLHVDVDLMCDADSFPVSLRKRRGKKRHYSLPDDGGLMEKRCSCESKDTLSPIDVLHRFLPSASPLISCVFTAATNLLVLTVGLPNLFPWLVCNKVALPREGRYAGSNLADTLISLLVVEVLALDEIWSW